MFSVIFQDKITINWNGKNLFNNYDLVKKLFQEADDVMGFSLTKMIFDGPKEDLDLTINTQPAIFLVSYSIFSNKKRIQY